MPLKPTIHTAEFVGTEVRVILFQGLTTVTVSTEVFDIGHNYRAGDIHDFLVQNVHPGQALASSKTESQATYVKVGTSFMDRMTGSHTEDPNRPDHSVVLMRGHGFAIVAPSTEQVIFQAIYTRIAAKVQTTASVTQRVYFGTKSMGRSTS